MNEKIKCIYDKTIQIVLSDIVIEEQKEMQEAYFKYLYEKYTDEFYNDISVDKIVAFEETLWKNKNSDYKKSSILTDEFLNKLGYISELGLKYAIKRLNNERLNNVLEFEISEEEARKNIDLMKQYFENVRPFNKTLAETYLSEGISDYAYASGLSNDISLRIGGMR